MKGVEVTPNQGNDPVIFESITDTLAGGVTLDLTGFTPIDGMVPGGLPIGRKDPETGLAKIVTVSPGAAPEDAATLSERPIGYLRKAVEADANPLAAVVISGVIRREMIPAAYQDYIDLLDEAMPKILSV